jgi:hypothetical protein
LLSAGAEGFGSDEVQIQALLAGGVNPLRYLISSARLLRIVN